MNVLASILSIIFILLKCEFQSAGKSHTTSHIFSEYGNLENISIQDILSTGINGNDQVIEKFLTLIQKMAYNFDTYSRIDLLVDEFHYPDPKFFELGLSNKSALFNNVSASQQYNGKRNRLFTTSVECDSSGIGIIRVSLPPTIKIEADLIIRSPKRDFKVMGNITYMMKSSAFAKQFYVSNNESNLESNIKQQLFYHISGLKLETDIVDHKVIYKKLHSFISNIESSLEHCLLRQLNAKLEERKATFSTFSKFTEPYQPNGLQAPGISPLVGDNAFLSELYIVPRVPFTKLSALSLYILHNFKPEFGQVFALNHNLVIVKGLSNFTNIKTTFLYMNNPADGEDANNDMIMRIKIGILTGKFTWIYRTKANDSEIARNIEFIFKVNRAEIEIKIRRYCSSWNDIYYHCYEFNVQDPQVGINLKIIQIKSNLPDIHCENMDTSVQNVLNEYLELAIGESLKNVITKKIKENRSLYLRGFHSK